MADPVTITLAAKAAIAAATDKRTWKAAGVLIAAILTPVILIIIAILSLLSGTSEHNNAAIELCFNGGVASSVPAEYRTHVEEMTRCFSFIDSVVSDVEAMMEGGSLDHVYIKSIFYSLYFGAESLPLSDTQIRTFVDCFVVYEERTRTRTDEITGEEETETYTVAVPVSLDTAYAALASSGLVVGSEAKANAQQIYQRIAYGGAGFYDGEIISGGSSGTSLDGLLLLHPETKNNVDLAAYAEYAFDSGWGYVWGTFGQVLTESLLDSKLKQYPDGVGAYEDLIRENWLGGRTADCIGLIKGYGWLDTETLKIVYGSNGMLDLGADGMYKAAVIKGSMDTMPDTPGIAVWKSGHIGVYIGNGEVIEAMGTKYGVVKTKLEGRGWKAWLEIPCISYLAD